MSSSNQRPANRGFRSVLRCTISQYRPVPSLSAPEPLSALRCRHLPVLRGRNRTVPIPRGVRPSAAPASPSTLQLGFRGLLQGRALHLTDPFERRDTLSGDRFELRPNLRRVVGDELGPVARTADLDVEGVPDRGVRMPKQ